jgi:hypothetical protein
MKEFMCGAFFIVMLLLGFTLGIYLLGEKTREDLVKRGLAEYTIDKNTGDKGFTFVVRGK